MDGWMDGVSLIGAINSTAQHSTAIEARWYEYDIDIDGGPFEPVIQVSPCVRFVLFLARNYTRCLACVCSKTTDSGCGSFFVI